MLISRVNRTSWKIYLWDSVSSGPTYFPGVSEVLIVTSRSFPSGTDAVKLILAPQPETKRHIASIKAYFVMIFPFKIIYNQNLVFINILWYKVHLYRFINIIYTGGFHDHSYYW